MRYSDEQLLEEIRRIAEIVGHSPTLQEFRDRGKYSATTYYERFGSWREAVAAAGYEPNQPESKISKQKLIEELQRVGEEYGAPPSASQMNEYGKYWASTYRNRFDSWNEAILAAGYGEEATLTEIPKAKLLKELRRLADTVDDPPPTFQQMDDKGKYAGRTYNRRFGSWNNALLAAGFEVSQEQSVSKRELINELCRLEEELNKTPSSRDMDSKGKYSVSTYQRCFDSWSAAVSSALESKEYD